MRRLAIIIPILVLVALPLAAGAASLPGKAITVTDITTTVKSAVQLLLTVSALAVVAFIVYGGALMATSAGDDTKYKKGKDIIKNAVIGALVIFAVGIIVNTIANFTKAPTDVL